MTKEYLMSECGANQFSKYTRLFLGAIASDVVTLSSKYPVIESETPQIIDTLYALGQMLDTPDSPSPAAFLDLENFGHFKECYTFSPSLVIKFCAKRNPTYEEKKALQDAKDHDLGYLFLPTFYHPLPVELTSSELEVDDDDMEIYCEEEGGWVENPEWEDNTILTTACLQLRAITAEQKFSDAASHYRNITSDAECNVTSSWAETRRVLGLPESEKWYDWRGLGGVCLLWARDFSLMYGVHALREFSLFCDEFHIWDLHSENVGYSLEDENGVSRPIILDWMSR